MARTRSRTPSDGLEPPPVPPMVPPTTIAIPPDQSVETTGRFLVLFREDAVAQALAALKDGAGLGVVVSSADYADGAISPQATAEPAVMVFDRLKVAVVNGDPPQVARVAALAAEVESPILAVEPERVV